MNLTDYRDITALLQRHGFRFSKSMGQNFLTAAWGAAADRRRKRHHGSRRRTRDRSRRRLSHGGAWQKPRAASRPVELDERLRDVLGETLADFDNVSVVFADALKADLLAICAETLGERPWKVCANLPYNVTTPLITAFLEAGCFESVTVMIQKEVAQRLCAAPGTGEYGAFSVLVQWYAEPKLLFDVPPHCFVPQPKVTSAVVRMDRRAAASREQWMTKALLPHRARRSSPSGGKRFQTHCVLPSPSWTAPPSSPPWRKPAFRPPCAAKRSPSRSLPRSRMRFYASSTNENCKFPHFFRYTPLPNGTFPSIMNNIM